MQKTFSQIIQDKLDKHNKRVARNRSLIDSILAQNQAGVKSGPIALSSLIQKGK